MEPATQTSCNNLEDKQPVENEIEAVFTQPGSIGLEMTRSVHAAAVEIKSVRPGTQAQQHPQLREGLILEKVAGSPVAGVEYQQVLSMIKAGGRPLCLSFREAPPPAGRQRVLLPERGGGSDWPGSLLARCWQACCRPAWGATGAETALVLEPFAGLVTSIFI